MAPCPILSKRILVQMEKRMSAVLAVKTEMYFSEAKSSIYDLDLFCLRAERRSGKIDQNLNFEPS